jgi:integrase
VAKQASDVKGVFRRGDKWVANPYIIPLGRKMWGGTFTRKKDAEAKALEMLLESQLGRVPRKPVDMTFGDMVAEFHRSSGADNLRTLRNQKFILNRATDFFGKSKSVRSITGRDFDAYVTDLRRSNYAPSTVRVHYRVTSSCLNAAVRWGVLDRNPAKDANRPPGGSIVNRKNIRPLVPEEHERFVASTDDFYQTLVYVWPLIGLRKGEILGLTWDDVDLDGKRINVRRQLQREGLEPLKTEQSNRVIFLSDNLVRRLKVWKVRCPHGRLGLVFPTPGGASQHPTHFQKWWNEARLKAKLPDLRPHDLRHTYATWLLAAGAPVHEVQARMGHAKPSITLDIYGHLLGDATSSADLLESWVLGRKRQAAQEAEG